MAVNGMVERLCEEEDMGYVELWDSFVGERSHVRERWPASEWKKGSNFCRVTVRGGRQWLG